MNIRHNKRKKGVSYRIFYICTRGKLIATEYNLKAIFENYFNFTSSNFDSIASNSQKNNISDDKFLSMC